MNWSMQFAFPLVLYIALPLLCAVFWYRRMYRVASAYRYPLTDVLQSFKATYKVPYKKIISFFRLMVLVGLALLIARPQLIDKQSQVNVEGIDIMLVLDVSGSMRMFEDLNDRTSRLQIAKDEAIKFVEKRDNDPIGLVIFAQEALSRCPVTLDKKMLESIIKDIQLGLINPEGTMLSKGLVMGINRMKKSKAKSKIVIALTDGEPTEGDLNPNIAIELAKKYGVKIYTIGIGSDGGYFEHEFFGLQQAQSGIDRKLLHSIAQSTGGQFFEARRSQELAEIYETIDKLERTEYETNIYYKKYDIFMPFLWILAIMISLELFLSCFVWFGL